MKPFFLILLLLVSSLSWSQNIDFARKLIDTLASPAFDGRGYVNNGDTKAAMFLSETFKEIGLEKFGESFLQQYTFPMNSLNGKVEAFANNIKLKAGSDFQVWSASPNFKGEYKVKYLTKEILSSTKKFKKFCSQDYSNSFILVDKKGIDDKRALSIIDSLKYYNFLKAKGIINVSSSKLVWSVMSGSRVRSYPLVDIKTELLSTKIKRFALEVESDFNPKHTAYNIFGYVKGSIEPDSFLIFTAHYDHLGRMGNDVYYPGANDNASGTAMVTDFARHYAQPLNAPAYSMVFILLSGEEAGLHGAEYCAANPPVNLKKVKFLINLDMVGTGSEGITMVNGSILKNYYDKMVKLNADNEYIMTVKARGESCNSDHCPFYKKGVPAVFIYSMGKEFGEYHNPDDQSGHLPLSEYNDIFRLLRDFMNGMKSK